MIDSSLCSYMHPEHEHLFRYSLSIYQVNLWLKKRSELKLLKPSAMYWITETIERYIKRVSNDSWFKSYRIWMLFLNYSRHMQTTKYRRKLSFLKKRQAKTDYAATYHFFLTPPPPCFAEILEACPGFFLQWGQDNIWRPFLTLPLKIPFPHP